MCVSSWSRRSQVAKLLPDARVERAERLVEEEDLRVDRERTREPHPLPLPARELRRIPLREPFELDEPEQLGDPLARLRLRRLTDLQPERDVLLHRHVLERRVVLEDEADAAVLRPPSRHLLARDRDRPGVRLLKACDDPEERRLPRPGRAEERDERACRDVERDVVEGLEVAEALRDGTNGDAHACSFGLNRLIRTSVAIATNASTTEAA